MASVALGNLRNGKLQKIIEIIGYHVQDRSAAVYAKNSFCYRNQGRIGGEIQINRGVERFGQMRSKSRLDTQHAFKKPHLCWKGNL